MRSCSCYFGLAPHKRVVLAYYMGPNILNQLRVDDPCSSWRFYFVLLRA